MSSIIGIERRNGTDRRKNNLSFFKQLFFKGRRRALRRASDRLNIGQIDQYGSSTFAVIMIILLLSLLDALLTLILLDRGAVEVNPIMAFYIEQGPTVFLMAKYLLTAAALILFLLFRDAFAHRYGFGSAFFILIGGVFTSVIVWEIYLVFLYLN